ncbi:MAG: hypothetical protein VX460_02980 [Planctomycetota bacterium]|nr:hypothetical protein [Planctomycetota bacterium]
MSPFGSQDGPAGEAPPRQPRFRLVEHGADATSIALKAPGDGVRALISPRLLAPEERWREAQSSDPTRLRGKAVLPIISSLCRIRSDADAALALTGVLETLAQRFGVELPCGDAEGCGFLFAAPAGTDLNEVAEAIDALLMGTVRASDLQGALRDRARARVTLESEGW